MRAMLLIVTSYASFPSMPRSKCRANFLMALFRGIALHHCITLLHYVNVLCHRIMPLNYVSLHHVIKSCHCIKYLHHVIVSHYCVRSFYHILYNIIASRKCITALYHVIVSWYCIMSFYHVRVSSQCIISLHHVTL